MRRIWIAASALLLGSAGFAAGQQAPASGSQGMGRGRGGGPFAWNDKDKDGICDVTGKPVGQGRAIGAGRGAGPGRGWRAGRGVCWRRVQTPPPAQRN